MYSTTLCKFVHLTWNMSPHYLVKCRTSIHWLFITGILLRNFLFKQLRCALKISKSMDFYCLINLFVPKLYCFPHIKWTQLHALKICPTAPANAQGDLTDSLPSVVARVFLQTDFPSSGAEVSGYCDKTSIRAHRFRESFDINVAGAKTKHW